MQCKPKWSIYYTLKTSWFHIATLGRTLDRWGFEFGAGKLSQHLKKKDEIRFAKVTDQLALKYLVKSKRKGVVITA
jgi:hypothetical protein